MNPLSGGALMRSGNVVVKESGIDNDEINNQDDRILCLEVVNYDNFSGIHLRHLLQFQKHQMYYLQSSKIYHLEP